jgi:hypothetical protein
MRRLLLIPALLSVTACGFNDTASIGKYGMMRPTLNGNGDYVLLDTCTRNGSYCPGKGLVEPGSYEVVGKTFLFGTPVHGVIDAWGDKTFALGRVYIGDSKYGQHFEGQWVTKCEVHGRSMNQSGVFVLTRPNCQEE